MSNFKTGITRSPIAPFLAKALMLIVMVLVVYAPSTENGFIWDDDHHVGMAPKNYEQGFATGLKNIWLKPLAAPQYYPMVWSSYLIEHHFWKQNPTGYHLVNILLHIIVALLLWMVLCHLGVPWPFATALLFALHPVHVETVAWVSERKNVLSGLFYMASLLAFLKWHAKYSDTLQAKLNGKFAASNVLYFISAVLFMAALASKTVTATLPFVIMLLLWWKHSLSRALVFRLIPFIILGVVMGCITIWMEQGHVGAVGEAWELSIIERGLIASRAIWFYAEKLLLPFNLTFIYPRWIIDSSELFQYLFSLGVLLVIIIFFLSRDRIGRGPLAAVLIYCGTLFPALGFLNVFPMQFSFVADHFQYLASAAMIALMVATAHCLLLKIDKRITGLLFLAVCGLYSVNDRQLQRQYKDQTALWLATVEKNPLAWIAHGNLGAIYMTEKRYPEAIESLTRATELNPKHIIPFNNLAKLYLNLAQTQQQPQLKAKYIEAALKHGLHAIELARNESYFFRTKLIQPRVAQDHLNSQRIVGDIKRYQNDNSGARFHYRSMLSLSPNSSDAHNRLGALDMDEGDHFSAHKHFSKSLLVKPKQFDTLYNLGVVSYKQGNYAQAVAVLNQALKMGAAEEFLLPHYYLGLVKLELGQGREAKQHFEIVALRMPEHAIGLKALQKMLDLELL